MAYRHLAYGMGKQAALEKIALHPLALGALAGGGLGALTGGLKAREGEGLRGALAGGLGGAALGTAGGALGGMGGLLGATKLAPKYFPHAVLGTLGGAGAGLLGGGIGGGLLGERLARKSDTWQDKLKALPNQAYEGLQGLLR